MKTTKNAKRDARRTALPNAVANYGSSPFGDLAERAGTMIRPDANGCWLWQGTLDRFGYGHFNNKAAHRWVWEVMRGSIPHGHVLHHECQVRSCVNPTHLVPMTTGEHSAHHRELRRGGHRC